MASTERFTLPGFRVGHWERPGGATGCSVLLPEEPALAVVDVRGGAPGTRELDVLGEGRSAQRVDAVLLTGGSAFGLAAATGVVRWLREQGRGFPTSAIPVPIVPAAVIFDLVAEHLEWPTEDAGYAAAAACEPDGWRSGPIGAGRGATVGKVAGREQAVAGGLGVARVALRGGHVAALVVVNALGEVVDPDTGRVVAGLRDGRRAEDVLLEAVSAPQAGENTTIGLVATDLPVDRPALVRMAIAAHDGLARAIRPAHTLFDGDTVFALASRVSQTDDRLILQLGTAAARATSAAILAAVGGGADRERSPSP